MWCLVFSFVLRRSAFHWSLQRCPLAFLYTFHSLDGSSNELCVDTIMASDWLFGFVSKSLRYGFACFSACRLQRWKLFSPQAFSTLPSPRAHTFFPISYHTKSAWRGMQILNLVSPNPWVKSSQILGYHKKLRCSAASKIIWFKVIYVFGGERRFSR